jgi:predicted phage terminase large subunit-like protein
MSVTLSPSWRDDPEIAMATLKMLRAARAKTETKTVYETPGKLAKALDPSTVQTPALDIIDQALVDVAEGRSKRLIISMPPQEGKSQRTTHYGALWMLHRNPNLRIGIVSYGDDIAGQFSYQIRNDIAVFDGSDGTENLGMTLQKDSKAASRWKLAHPNNGGVYSIGIGGALTGRPIDLLFIDDPVKDFRSADSLLQSEQAWAWWQSVARPRLHPNAPVILILTRWHEADLAGRLLQKQAEDEKAGLEYFDKWDVINIPAQADYDPALGQTDPLGREPGEFMVSARGRTRAQWEATKAATAPRIWSALYQGRPSPDAGDVWKRPWWRRYTEMLWTLDENGAYRVECDEMIMSWDMTFKDTRSSDFVVGQVWARRGANVYLLDQVHKRLSFTDTLNAFTALCQKWPQATAKLVEDKANGTAVIDSLKSKVPGIIPITPHESKYARANAVSPYIEAGNVHLPTSEIALFEVEGFIEESAAFPNAAHDDRVDSASQALARLFISGSGAGAWIEYMRNRANGSQDPVEVPEQQLTDRESVRQAAFAAGNFRTGTN